MSEDDNTQHKSRSWLERLTALVLHEPKNKVELMDLIRDSEERDVISNEVLGMIERILQVSEMQVREVMVPKAQMVMIEQGTSLQILLPIVIESRHSRFPVYDPANGNIIGIFLAKDLLQFYNKGNESFALSDILRAPFFTPQSKRLDVLLREFRVNRNHLAIVLDEYGHVAGLVTIEDVLEQIVGEIEDEYDIDEDDIYIKKLNEDTYIVKASTPIDEFNEYFNTKFKDDEFDTIGGILLKEFGHLPKRGEIIKIASNRFKVLNCDNRRIYLLEVKTSKKKIKEI